MQAFFRIGMGLSILISRFSKLACYVCLSYLWPIRGRDFRHSGVTWSQACIWLLLGCAIVGILAFPMYTGLHFNLPGALGVVYTAIMFMCFTIWFSCGGRRGSILCTAVVTAAYTAHTAKRESGRYRVLGACAEVLVFDIQI